MSVNVLNRDYRSVITIIINSIINYDPSTFDEKNSELWSTNERVYVANVYPPTIVTERAV